MPDVPIKTVGIVSKPRTDRAATVVPALVKWLQERGIAANAARGAGDEDYFSGDIVFGRHHVAFSNGSN